MFLCITATRAQIPKILILKHNSHPQKNRFLIYILAQRVRATERFSSTTYKHSASPSKNERLWFLSQPPNYSKNSKELGPQSQVRRSQGSERIKYEPVIILFPSEISEEEKGGESRRPPISKKSSRIWYIGISISSYLFMIEMVKRLLKIALPGLFWWSSG